MHLSVGFCIDELVHKRLLVLHQLNYVIILEGLAPLTNRLAVQPCKIHVGLIDCILEYAPLRFGDELGEVLQRSCYQTAVFDVLLQLAMKLLHDSTHSLGQRVFQLLLKLHKRLTIRIVDVKHLVGHRLARIEPVFGRKLAIALFRSVLLNVLLKTLHDRLVLAV